MKTYELTTKTYWKILFHYHNAANSFATYEQRS